MIEKDYVRKLKKHLEEAGFFVIKHADAITSGVPDLSIHRSTRTSWVEVKVSRDGRSLRHREVQRIQIQRLSMSTYVHYVIFDVSEGRTLIVPPSRLSEWNIWVEYAPGISYDYVVNFLKELHS